MKKATAVERAGLTEVLLIGIEMRWMRARVRPMASGVDFRHAIGEVVAPALIDFHPDMLIISAGFDAHVDDPLASVALETEDFAWATRELIRIADMVCGGRVV